MFLAAIIIAFALIMIVVVSHHIGYTQAMREFDRDIDKIYIEVLKQLYVEKGN